LNAVQIAEILAEQHLKGKPARRLAAV